MLAVSIIFALTVPLAARRTPTCDCAVIGRARILTPKSTQEGAGVVPSLRTPWCSCERSTPARTFGGVSLWSSSSGCGCG